MRRRELDLGSRPVGPTAPDDTTGTHYGRGPRNYRRRDTLIHEDVSERLMEHGELDASDIDVLVENGEVTLVGTVADRRQKRLAEDLAEHVRGVVDVHNRLRVRPGDPALASTIALSGGDSTNLSTAGTTMTGALDTFVHDRDGRSS